MIKYSIVLLAAAAVVFSVGCDSECCGVVDNNPEATNVAPVITRVLGATNNGTKTCTPGETVSLVADATDKNSNLDSSTYSWVEKVGSNENALGTTITCPADGASTKICATVKDKEGLESDEVCVNLKGQATEVSDSCPTELKVTVNGNENFTQFDKSHGQFGDYNISTNFANCPQVNCTWTVHSFQDNGTDFNCITGSLNGAAPSEPEHIKSYNGTTQVSYSESSNKITITPSICSSLYKRVEINATCTRAGSTSVFKTSKVFTINN